MDRILIEGASFQAHVGVLEHERRRMQEVVIDIQALLETGPAGLQDDLVKTVNYVEIHDIAARTVASKHYHLIEGIAEDLAAALLHNFAAVTGVVVKVSKPAALAARGVRSAAVEITRMKNE